jgi:DNA topoisomerase VI subunit B
MVHVTVLTVSFLYKQKASIASAGYIYMNEIELNISDVAKMLQNRFSTPNTNFHLSLPNTNFLPRTRVSPF